MKAFKVFNKDITFVNNSNHKIIPEIGKVYDVDTTKEKYDGRKMDEFSSYKNPMFCLKTPTQSKIYKVDIDEAHHYNKDVICSKKITLKKEMSVASIAKAVLNYFKENVDECGVDILRKHDEHRVVVADDSNNYEAVINRQDYNIAANNKDRMVSANKADNSIAACSGYGSLAINESDKYSEGETYNCVAVCSNSSSVAINNAARSISVASTEKSVAISNFDYSISVVNDIESVAVTNEYKSVAIGSYCYSSAIANDKKSVAIVNGYHSSATVTAKNGDSIAISVGIDCIAKAALGCWIVLADWQTDENNKRRIANIKSFKVDGETVKADTYYTLKNGELTKVDDPSEYDLFENFEQN